MAPTFDQCNTRRNDTYVQLCSATKDWKRSHLLTTELSAIVYQDMGYQLFFVDSSRSTPRSRDILLCAPLIYKRTTVLSQSSWRQSDLGPRSMKRSWTPPPTYNKNHQIHFRDLQTIHHCYRGCFTQKKPIFIYLLHEKRSSPKLYFYVWINPGCKFF